MPSRFRQFRADSQRASTGKNPPLAASRHEFWLIFDADGKITYCTEWLAQLMGRDAADIRGADVISIVPGLPVKRRISGHNVAALPMKYANRAHRLRLAIGEGRMLPVEASISSIHLGTGPVFIVELHSPARAGKVSRPVAH